MRSQCMQTTIHMHFTRSPFCQLICQRPQEVLLQTILYKVGLLSHFTQSDHLGQTSRTTMAVYIRSAIAVLTALFVLAQPCSANTSAAQPTSDVDKITRPKTGAFVQNGKSQSSTETSKDDELRERADVVNVRRTCANPKQLRMELLVRVSSQISKASTGQRRWEMAHPKRGAANTRIDMSSSENAEGLRKRIVYPTAGKLIM